MAAIHQPTGLSIPVVYVKLTWRTY